MTQTRRQAAAIAVFRGSPSGARLGGYGTVAGHRLRGLGVVPGDPAGGDCRKSFGGEGLRTFGGTFGVRVNWQRCSSSRIQPW